MTGHTWVRLCRAEEIEDDRPRGVVIDETGQDRDRVCVARRGEAEYIAMLDRCPHRDISLSGGVIHDGLLICPGHFWRFSLQTGQRTDKPDEVARLYQTRVIDGWVEALVPDPAPPMSMREWLLQQARER